MEQEQSLPQAVGNSFRGLQKDQCQPAQPPHGFHSTISTSYYATFQVESGDRMELSVTGTEYGLLAEGDRGKLTFQGTRYLGFERLGNVEPV